MDRPRLAAAGGHVVLCGLNELGYRTLEELVRLGEEVVVARSPEGEPSRGAAELGATLVTGSYRDQVVLAAAGVPTARAMVVRRAAPTGPGVLLPLARVHPDGTAELFPDTGEEVLCLAEAPARRSRHPERPALEQPSRLATVWTALLRADARLRMMTAIVLGLTLTGIAVLWWFSDQDLDLIDAVYFTVTIMTTTGFGDIHLRDAPPPLQLYGVALMLSGTAALAILFALITDALISARLARVLGAAIPRDLHDHVVVCGLGNIGYRMVEQLHDLGVPVVAAELHESNRYLPAVRRLGVPVLVADIRLTDTLQLLRVERARGIHISRSPSVLAVARLRVEAGCQAQGRTVAELVVVVPRGELGRVVAWTETGVETGRHARP